MNIIKKNKGNIIFILVVLAIIGIGYFSQWYSTGGNPVDSIYTNSPNLDRLKYLDPEADFETYFSGEIDMRALYDGLKALDGVEGSEIDTVFMRDVELSTAYPYPAIAIYLNYKGYFYTIQYVEWINIECDNDVCAEYGANTVDYAGFYMTRYVTSSKTQYLHATIWKNDIAKYLMEHFTISDFWITEYNLNSVGQLGPLVVTGDGNGKTEESGCEVILGIAENFYTILELAGIDPSTVFYYSYEDLESRCTNWNDFVISTQ